MKCMKCGTNEATVHTYLSVDGHMQKTDLCENCAKALNIAAGFGEYGLFDKIFGGSPMGLLPGLFKLFDTPTTQALSCPTCKTTGEEFVKTGFVGCPDCYKVFEPLIVQTVKKLQQSDRHVGKTPDGAIDVAAEEMRLKAELQAAIDCNDYAKLGELSEKLKMLVGNKRGGDM